MKLFGAFETLGRALFYVTDILVGEVLGDARVANGVVERVARVRESLCHRNRQVDFGHACVVPDVEPVSQVLSDLVVLVSVPQRDGVPDPHERNLEETQVAQALLGEFVKTSKPNEDAFLVLTFVVRVGFAAKCQLGLAWLLIEQGLEVRRLLAGICGDQYIGNVLCTVFSSGADNGNDEVRLRVK